MVKVDDHAIDRFGLGRRQALGRDFIGDGNAREKEKAHVQPSQTIRQLGIRLKLNPIRDVIEGKRLVVVDDSITVREVERKLLEAHGYEVDVCVDGVDAWNSLRGGRYDLSYSFDPPNQGIADYPLWHVGLFADWTPWRWLAQYGLASSSCSPWLSSRRPARSN